MATNRLPAASRNFDNDNSTINLEIGARPQAACGSTLTFCEKMNAPPVGLLAAIHADYISPKRWVAWADWQIGRTEEPPMWLIDLSLAGDSSAAWKAIGESIHDTPELSLQELDEIALGLIALQYFEGEIDLSTFLHRAGDHTDPSNCSTDCEYFYQHLNRYESATSPRDYEESSRSRDSAISEGGY